MHTMMKRNRKCLLLMLSMALLQPERIVAASASPLDTTAASITSGRKKTFLPRTPSLGEDPSTRTRSQVPQNQKYEMPISTTGKGVDHDFHDFLRQRGDEQQVVQEPTEQDSHVNDGAATMFRNDAMEFEMRRRAAKNSNKNKKKNRRHPDGTAVSVTSNGVFDKENEIARRHAATFKRYAAKYSYPLTMTTSLMLSPCRPDANGYFGSTQATQAGTSVTELQYRFELYTVANLKEAKRKELLYVMDDMVMDAVLSHVFPTVCSFSKDDLAKDGGKPDFSGASKDFQVTGFYFGIQDGKPLEEGNSDVFSTGRPDKDEKHQAQKCQSASSSEDGTVFLMNLNNNKKNKNKKNAQQPDWECREYMSTVKVFGRGNTAESVPAISEMIFQAIEQSLARTGPLGAEHVHSLGSVITLSHDDGSAAESGFGAQNTNHQILIVLTIAVVLFAVAAIGLFCFFRRQAQQVYSDGKWDNSTVSTAIGSLLFLSTTGSRVDQTKQSRHPDDSTLGSKSNMQSTIRGSTIRNIRHPPVRKDESSRKSRNSSRPGRIQMKRVPTGVDEYRHHPQKHVVVEFAADYDDSHNLYEPYCYNVEVSSQTSSLPSDYYDRPLDWEGDVAAQKTRKQLDHHYQANHHQQQQQPPQHQLQQQWQQQRHDQPQHQQRQQQQYQDPWKTQRQDQQHRQHRHQRPQPPHVQYHYQQVPNQHPRRGGS